MSMELSRKAANVKPSSTLAITAKANELKSQGIDVVGFGAGQPDFNTPENICEAAIKAIHDGFTKYTPASGTNELRAAISKKFKSFNNIDYAPEQIIISNGGKHSLTNVFQAILNPGDEVIIPAPYWLSYPELVKLFDGVPVYAYTTKEENYKITPELIERSITPKTKAIIFNSPNNPTGMVYSEEELRAIAEVVVKHDIYAVADEMYEMLVYGGRKFTSLASLGKEIYDHTITVSGLSKSYAMTGWRIGYTGSSLEIAKMMGAIQSHETSNPNSIAQKGAYEALVGPQDEVAKMKEAFEERKSYIYNRVKEIKYLSCLEPEGAFYLFVDCAEALTHTYKGQKIDIMEMARILLEEYHVAVVPCKDFGFPQHMRLSYAISIETIGKGIDRIAEFINNLD